MISHPGRGRGREGRRRAERLAPEVAYAYLAGDMSAGVEGEVLFVHPGCHLMGVRPRNGAGLVHCD